MACCAPKVRLIGVGIAGLVILLFGIITGWVIVPRVVREKIAEVIPLRPQSESWDRWKNPPVPIQSRIFIFNVNNPNEILEGKIPNVTEVGPYIYKEKRMKNILSVDEENSNALYEHKYVFEFDAEASAPLKEDDELTVVNAPPLLFGLTMDNLKSISPVIKLFNTSIRKMWPTKDSNPFFMKAKVKDYLFNGLPILCNQTKSLQNLDVKILCEAFRILHPKTIVLDDPTINVHSFAFFRYKNNTGDGIFKIDLGIHDVTKIGQILSWNNAETLSVWKGKTCNKIQGTDATAFRPYLEMDDIQSLNIYHSDACRSIKLVYESDTEFKGVKGRRYIPDKSFLASVHNDSENYCFCPQSVREVTHYGGCLRSGVLELTNCQGAPAIISYPHFFMADPIYQNKIKGLNPDKDKHHIYIDLEPNTGYPLRATSRMQINVFLKSIPEMYTMKNLSNLLMPVLWVEEKVELTDELINIINSQMLSILRIMDILKWIMIASGIILSVGSCGYYFIKFRPERGTQHV